jgi:hypothetical protein
VSQLLSPLQLPFGCHLPSEQMSWPFCACPAQPYAPSSRHRLPSVPIAVPSPGGMAPASSSAPPVPEPPFAPPPVPVVAPPELVSAPPEPFAPPVPFTLPPVPAEPPPADASSPPPLLLDAEPVPAACEPCEPDESASNPDVVHPVHATNKTPAHRPKRVVTTLRTIAHRGDERSGGVGKGVGVPSNSAHIVRASGA